MNRPYLVEGQKQQGIITRDRGDDTYDIKFLNGSVNLDIEKDDITLDESEGENTFQDEGQLAIIECLLTNGANVNEIDQETTG